MNLATLGDIHSKNLAVILPEFYLCIASMVLLVYGVYRLKRANGFLVFLGLLILAFTLDITACRYDAPAQTVFNHMFTSNQFTSFAKVLLILSSAMTLLLSAQWLKEEDGRPFEFVILVLFSTLGMMLMISAGDLLTLYMSLELWSLASYVLSSFLRDSAKSSEAGLKYFVLGALASGMMLFGMSLVYGFAGSTAFDALSALFVHTGAAVSKGVIVGLILVIIGLCFKLSAVPFHMWTPDVYEGAPTPVTIFFATAPKVATLGLFARMLLGPFGPLVSQWQQVILLVSVASMVVGALAAITQTNIKRLLAYSSIGHAGFMLMGLAVANKAGVQAMMIYLAVYIFMSAGAFGCVLLMRKGGNSVEEIADLKGLAQTQPLFAGVIALFMFSMAGIPPLAGFFGKFYVILAAVNAGLVWFAVIAVLASVVGCYYYLKVVKVMYFDEPAGRFDPPIELQGTLYWGIGITAFVTAFFFLVPTPLLQQAKQAAEALLQ